MMDLSILVFFQQWLINNDKELTNKDISDCKSERSQTANFA